MSSIVKVDTIQENTSANGITVDGLNIKDSKLVTANSVIAANITADAIDATKIADNAISEEHLDVTSITGHTAETSIADGDTILIHDASASALRKMTKANFLADISNTHYYVKLSGDQTVANNTTVNLAFAAEQYDVGSNYNNSTYLYTAPSAGKYMFHVHIRYNDAQSNRNAITLAVNNSTSGNYSFEQTPGNVFSTTGGMALINLNANDTIQWRYYQSTGGNVTIRAQDSFIGGFRLV
tara:strand:+ start:799 stop:1518 length:720 start_codon:yes stop_codon:yes gene_type:complete